MHFWIRGWKCIKLTGTSRHPHVMTSQHRDVGLTNVEVNKQQHRDVSMSRHLNVATLQRRDVRAIPVSPSLKAKRGPEFEAWRSVRTRARKSEQQRL